MTDPTYPPGLEALPQPFKKGDRVRFTPHVLTLCDPAITEAEYTGEVLSGGPNSWLLTVQFDSGDRGTFPATYFEKKGPTA